MRSVMTRKIINGLAELESSFLAQMHTKFNSLETQCQGTQEVLHELGVRMVKVEANAIRLGDRDLASGDMRMMFGAIDEKMGGLEISEKICMDNAISLIRNGVLVLFSELGTKMERMFKQSMDSTRKRELKISDLKMT